MNQYQIWHLIEGKWHDNTQDVFRSHSRRQLMKKIRHEKNWAPGQWDGTIKVTRI